MLEAQKEKYRKIVRKAAESLGKGDPEAMELVFEKLRTANEAMIEKKGAELKPDAASALREALEDVIAEERGGQKTSQSGQGSGAGVAFNAPPVGPAPRRRSSALAVIAGLVIGALIGAGGLYAAAMSDVIALGGKQAPKPVQPDAPKTGVDAAFQKAYQASLPQVDVATAYLETVRAAIAKRQKDDAAGLTTAAGAKFVALKALDAKLAAGMPRTLPAGSAVLLRANATDYKIIYNWPLCATVQFARPDMVDPVRAIDGLGCGGFGVWTAGAAKW